MRQHISNYLLYVTPIAAGITFLVSLTVFFHPAKERWLTTFAYFLLVNWLMETWFGYLALARVNNLFLGNLETMLVTAFELYLIMAIIRRKMAKKALLYIIITYILFSLINILFIQRDGFHTTSYGIGCLLIVGACMYYFWELFQQPSSIRLAAQPAFWICSGLLFYYCCTFPIYGFTKLLEALPVVIMENLVFIFDLLNIFLYLSFTIAFLCRLKIKKSMSSY